MHHNQKLNTSKIETAGIWAASIILLAFFIAGQTLN